MCIEPEQLRDQTRTELTAMADHPFDPHSDEIPQDSFTLAAHEALALVAGSSLAQFFECIPATVWTTDTDLKLTFAQGPILRDLDVAPEKCSAGRCRKSFSTAARIIRSFRDI